MTEEQVLVKKRGNIKGRLTQFTNYINTLPEILNNELRLELQLRISRIEPLLDSFDEIQGELECASDNSPDQFKERNSFESMYYKAVALAKSKLGSSAVDEPSQRCESDCGSVVQHTRASVKLPVIQLAKFDGSYDSWLEFRDTYLSIIHDNADLSPINKFHYLRSSLVGSALLVIKSLHFSSANYPVAWKLICDRYDNKRMLISNHVKSIFNVSQMQKDTSFHLKRLVDSFVKNLRSLATLGEQTNSWDTLLIYMLSSKFDPQTLLEWEKYKVTHEKQSLVFDDLLKFTRDRIDLLETLEQTKPKYVKQSGSILNASTINNSKYRCPICQSDHLIYYCKTFLNFNSTERESKANSLNLCLNCLKGGHTTKKCRLASSCKRCNKRHNSLICPELPRNVAGAADAARSAGEVALSCAALSPQGLLSTACVSVRSTEGLQRVRIMLDSGSTSNFITEHLCKQLRLPTKNITTTINSFNQRVSLANKCCDINIQSLHSNFNTTITCIVISKITNPWPSSPIDKTSIKIPQEIELSDPEFYKPSYIDILLGNGVFWDIIEPEQIKLSTQNITIQKSKLGWILGGSIKVKTTAFCNFSSSQNLNEQVAKFWELDNIEAMNPYSEWSPEEIQCEQHFVDTTSRLANGRFCVTIPLKLSPDLLGDSYNLAKSRFLQLEKKFRTNIKFKTQYSNFMNEYINLGHMRESSNYNKNQVSYFAPHHGVERKDSLTTKLRVVFDCSAKSSSGYSFNELQRVGPTIQDNLFSILLRFRQHNIVLTADIEKMYRQIEITEGQRSLQQILWREDPKQPLKSYELNTVTYGTASAPFLAIRCLKQLANECHDLVIKEIIDKDFFVDDLITGSFDINEILRIQNLITEHLKTGCFSLRKWCSNSPEVLKAIKCNDNISHERFDLCPNNISKTLGINWDHASDDICFNIKLKTNSRITKRNILSTIAQLFDPLGLITPSILQAKIILQRLWLAKLTWDDEIPEAIRDAWIQFINSLPLLNKLNIPRHVILSEYVDLQLHVFTDASEEAYGACAYIRSAANNNLEVLVRLLCSKNKVAPLKTQTIPRLELCGALLGVRLGRSIINSLRLQFNHCYYWTDSTIVLGWLSTPAHKLQTFVRNRVAEIQSTCNDSFQYVPTNLNPSDYLTRSLPVDVLIGCEQWWNGPQFLKNNKLLWPKLNLKTNKNETLPELKNEVSVMNIQTLKSWYPFHVFSIFSRMQRSMAYLLRFIYNTRNKNEKQTGSLSISELRLATSKLAMISQQDTFPIEYKNLESSKSLRVGSSLLSLNPFFDHNSKLIRVGGRLHNSDYMYNKKHPILLHKNHIFTKLLFNSEHRILMHAGPQHLLYSTRERYWTIGGRDLARRVSRDCITCNRFRGKTVSTVMGNLPKERFNTTFAFQYTALDYAGPVMIANREGRGCRLIKSYICVFVCFSTKAIHIELVSNMSTTNFIAALRRFIARRGKPAYIYSDNGSNFVGANNELKRMISSHGEDIISTMTQQSIKFSFSPPFSPHFGGLHEAGVKSIKHHLKRVLGNSNLTFEQLYTTLTQIEAILNSRPISPLSSDPQDLSPLTPGHFLIGKQLTSIPEPDYAEVNTHCLDRYQRIVQLRQQFWSRWHKEYITELQTRSKWTSSKGALHVGDLVLIKGDNQPPMRWLMGRIIHLYPGNDGVARVADIRTSAGVLRRSFTKICPLPLPDMKQD